LFGFDQGTKSIQAVFIKMRLVDQFSFSGIPLPFSKIKFLVSQLKFHWELPKIFSL
jgi:hypothetical protein